MLRVGGEAIVDNAGNTLPPKMIEHHYYDHVDIGPHLVIHPNNWIAGWKIRQNINSKRLCRPTRLAGTLFPAYTNMENTINMN